nr:penicillin-binding protein 2 [Bifidobacterium aemilianum]
MASTIRFARKRRFAFKCMAVGVVLALLAVMCLGQLASIQLLNGRTTAQAATAQRTLKVDIQAKRGKILDTNGVVLAQSVERYTIIGNPELAQEFEPTPCGKQTKGRCHQIDGKPVGTTGAAAVARLLAPVLDMNPMELGAKFSGTGQYVVIKKDVTPEVKRNIDKLNLGWIVYAELSSQRYYSTGTMMGTLLGGVDDKGKGVAGLEQVENKNLTGTDGYRIYQRGNGGEEIPGTVTDAKDALDGSDVKLTLNSDVDWYVKKVIREGMEKYKAGWVTVVVQDAKSGEIIALEDSDEYAAGSSDAKLNVSRAVSQTFEPGSIGKVLSVAGMLQSGASHLTDQYTVPDHLSHNNQNYKDAVMHGAAHWTLAGILEQSSNVGMIMAADGKYNSDQRYDNLVKFGIGQDDGLGLPGESPGRLTNPQAWDVRTKETVLFGQGYSTNALQITNAVATVANKGVKQQQSIVKEVVNADGQASQVPRGEPVRVVDEQVANQVMNAMESSAEHYAQFSGVDGYRVAAKSGTAEVAGANGRLTSIISDWSGALPAEDPRFVVTVVMKDPQGSLGGVTAGPLFKQIGEFLMQKYQIPPSQPRTDAIPVQW